MKISICIPTYNRAEHLANCLQSIIANKSEAKVEFQICVSDNGSIDETESVVVAAQQQIPIKYKRQSKNFGPTKNFLDAVEMSDGDFVWLIGDDDLLLPDAIRQVSELIKEHPGIDHFYVNSFEPNVKKPVSRWPHSGEMKFFDLIDPRISSDFLGGVFLSVFRRDKWISNTHVIDKSVLGDPRVFSHFDNTFPHIKIFAKAFANSKAYFHANPLSISLSGAREWAHMNRFVKSIRLVEALDEYRKNGLPFIRFLQCKNFALRTFLPNLAYMLIYKNSSGFSYVKNPVRLILSYLLFPNFYFSVIYYFTRKLKWVLKTRERAILQNPVKT